MRTRYDEKGNITLSFQDLLEHLPDADKVDLIEHLSCDDAVIKHVTDQILEGWTENSYHGSVSCEANAEPHRGLDWARRRVAKLASDVAKTEIEKLETALGSLQKRYQELADEIHARRERYL